VKVHFSNQHLLCAHLGYSCWVW